MPIHPGVASHSSNNAMLKSIRIEKFKGIHEINLQLGEINVLVGGNNAGKSSVLQAIQFAVSIAQTTNTQNTRWTGDRMPSSLSSRDLIYSPINDIYSLGYNGLLQEDLSEAIQISFDNEVDQTKIIVRKGRNKNITIAIEGKVLGERLRNLDEPFCIIVPGLAGIPAQETYKTPTVVRRLAARGDSNSVFRNILLQLKKRPADWKGFAELLDEIYPGIDVAISFDEQADEFINATTTQEGRTLPIDASGTGVLQAIQILSYVFLFKPKLLILDEPDSHLHPNNQRKLVEILLKAQSKNGAQIIISTHSKYIIDELLDNAAIFWINKGAIVDKIDNSEEAYVLKSLMEIGALSEGESLGAEDSKITVITEDQEANFIKLLLASNGWCLDEIEIWPYQGCSNIQVANALIKYIRRKRPDQLVVLHRDRDFLSQDELDDYATRIGDEKTRLFVPEKNDLEAFFLRQQHVLSVYPEFTADDYWEIINTAINEKRGDLIAKLINTRIDALRKRGEKVNEGAVAVECSNNFDSNPLDFSHGKLLLRAVNSVLREKTGANSKLLASSPALSISLLQVIKDETWPPMG